MADTSAQKRAELWVVRDFLPKKFNGLSFEEQPVQLVWGGNFAFDAVTTDHSTVGLVSTSSAKTVGGNQATAKIQKIKCDTLYLLNIATPCQKLLIFSELSMLDYFQKNVKSGRFPKNIELLLAELPSDILAEVHNSRMEAQREVSPSNSNNTLKT